MPQPNQGAKEKGPKDKGSKEDKSKGAKDKPPKAEGHKDEAVNKPAQGGKGVMYYLKCGCCGGGKKEDKKEANEQPMKAAKGSKTESLNPVDQGNQPKIRRTSKLRERPPAFPESPDIPVSNEVTPSMQARASTLSGPVTVGYSASSEIKSPIQNDNVSLSFLEELQAKLSQLHQQQTPSAIGSQKAQPNDQMTSNPLKVLGSSYNTNKSPVQDSQPAKLAKGKKPGRSGIREDYLCTGGSSEPVVGQDAGVSTRKVADGTGKENWNPGLRKKPDYEQLKEYWRSRAQDQGQQENSTNGATGRQGYNQLKEYWKNYDPVRQATGQHIKTGAGNTQNFELPEDYLKMYLKTDTSRVNPKQLDPIVLFHAQQSGVEFNPLYDLGFEEDVKTNKRMLPGEGLYRRRAELFCKHNDDLKLCSRCSDMLDKSLDNADIENFIYKQPYEMLHKQADQKLCWPEIYINQGKKPVKPINTSDVGLKVVSLPIKRADKYYVEIRPWQEGTDELSPGKCDPEIMQEMEGNDVDEFTDEFPCEDIVMERVPPESILDALTRQLPESLFKITSNFLYPKDQGTDKDNK